MFAYCLNNPVIYGDYRGYDAILLLDKANVGHMGIMVQDSEGNWWHFYWGTSSLGRRILCALTISVKPTTWCVQYTGEISLDSINKSEYYDGYDEYERLYGDFSSCIEEMKSPIGKYNLYWANCSQVSLGILAKAETSYSSSLSSAANIRLPAMAFQKIKTDIALDKLMQQINAYVNEIAQRVHNALDKWFGGLMP